MNKQYLIFLFFRLSPYCRTKILSSEDESSLDYDDTDEENDTCDRVEEDDTPPKVNKVAFHVSYDAILDTLKLRLSTDKIVEDILKTWTMNSKFLEI